MKPFPNLTYGIKVTNLKQQTEMNDMANHKLRWGKYKGKHLKDVPNSYLQWILDKKPDILKGKMLVYVKMKLGIPKDKYQVIVTDSVGTDGAYVVEAYTKKQAMWQCTKQYNIICTQSYHGTEFDIQKL